MKSNLIIPFETLPTNFAERHDALRNYFCDKDAIATRTPEGWKLTLQWPGGEDRHVDYRLPEGLTWWGDAVTLSTMVTATKRKGKILDVLYDSWTLHSWSQWVKRQLSSRTDVIILHVDDHRDIASPRLLFNNNVFVDAITGYQCDFLQPETIEASILSGAIGMGSFMTPFLHWFPNTEVRHLCQPPKVNSTLDYKFQLTTEFDTVLYPGRERPAISLSRSNDSAKVGPGCYRYTPYLYDWLYNIDSHDPRPILLHIDMDYFNNRYDGDSDWTSRSFRLDHTVDNVIIQIDLFTNAIREANISTRIEDIVIAYSPGFFPGELWKVTSERLHAGLALGA